MAVFRYQVVSVGLWRGKIKRWNTTFHLGRSDIAGDVQSKMQQVCYPNPGDAVGACSGGVASISVYASTGGAPITKVEYFDWQSPGTWIPFTGTAWSGIPTGTPVDASGESAAVIVGHMATLSRTGKPVTTRKYIHAVPSRTAAAYGDPDIPTAVQTAIASVFPLGELSNPAGVSPATATCEPYYLNHQRVRGRRRTRGQVAAQSFSAGVVAGTGAGAAAAQGAAPFPGE